MTMETMKMLMMAVVMTMTATTLPGVLRHPVQILWRTHLNFRVDLKNKTLGIDS